MGEIHNSCFMQLGTNLTEKLVANGSKMSSRRMGSTKMEARLYIVHFSTFSTSLRYALINTLHHHQFIRVVYFLTSTLHCTVYGEEYSNA